MFIRNAIVSVLTAIGIFASGCAIDPTSGIAASRGPTGSLGAECHCSTGEADCDGVQGQCESPYTCSTDDSGKQACTQDCPCPLNYICKAAGLPGSRLSCWKQP